MKIRRPKSAAEFFPAVLLLSTVLLLALILASLGQRNLEREKTLLLDLKGRHAEFIVRSLASASRISVLMLDPASRHLERFVNDAAQASEVVFIAVYDHMGRLVASSHRFDPDLHGLTVAQIEGRLGSEEGTFSLDNYPDLGKVYTLARRFFPFDRSWLHLRMLGIPSIPGITDNEDHPEDGAGTYYALVGMDTAALDEAVRKGTRQALLNGFMFLLIGTIGFYFLILVHGYYSARRALTDVKQFTVDVIDGMAEGLINIDNVGILRTVNPEAEAILRIGSKDLVGKHWREAFGDEAWEPAYRYLSSGTPFYDLEISPGDSNRPYLRITMIPVRGEAGGVVLFLRDLGEVKSLQAEVHRSERLAALGRMVAGMAHEIRNPLNSIRGFSQHLRSRFETDSVERRSVDTIVREVDRLNRVITELLDFSRPKDPDLSQIDLNEIVRSTTVLIEGEATSQGVICVEALSPGPVHLLGDGDSLKQLLLNLFLNAIQAMSDGGVLTVSTSLSGDRAELTVADTGTGIDEMDLDRIFEPFYTTREAGTGLGLSIVHRIVQDHGGEIRLSSSPGQGTTFVIRFPLAGGNADAETR
jgi:two-component system sensor histidine kinase HydH